MDDVSDHLHDSSNTSADDASHVVSPLGQCNSAR